MTLFDIRHILQQAGNLETIEWIYFEGGEPFLYYATLLKGVQESVKLGFRVGVLSDVYWATSVDDAKEYLRPLAGLITDFSVSSDLYHYDDKVNQLVKNATEAANQLEIPLGMISIAQPESEEAGTAVGQLPYGETKVIYRGRAVEKLVPKAKKYPWEQFIECTYEDLRNPERVHIDPLGNVHICQGISIGNLFKDSLIHICERYDPDAHPITAPLLKGGPVELVKHYKLSHEQTYADACHLCYNTRKALRQLFPEILTPDQMYGIFNGK
jgi:MoaA/NifB/PqqE/SkfB family radical SAM enzyme